MDNKEGACLIGPPSEMMVPPFLMTSHPHFHIIESFTLMELFSNTLKSNLSINCVIFFISYHMCRKRPMNPNPSYFHCHLVVRKKLRSTLRLRDLTLDPAHALSLDFDQT